MVGIAAGLLLSGASLFAPSASAEEEKPDAVPAMILKVEGEGIAKVKKAFGVEESAGAGGKLFPGDKIITDDRSAVFLILNDGSVLKVGFNTEFKLEATDVNDRFLSWAFRIVKGTMRALVEKNPAADTRVRINTPSGTIGVRGTEFVVAVDEESRTSYLYTIEGLVSHGPPDCEQKNTCIDVRAGETSSLQEGQKEAPKPSAYQPRDLFAVKPADADGKRASSATTDARMSLFQDARRVNARFQQDMGDEALRSLVKEASESLAEAQDRAIGRTKAQRIAMHKAVKDGTYKDILAAADAYAEKKDIFKADTNGGAENHVAQTAAAKFRLGQAVKEAMEAGLFGNSSMKAGLAVKWDQEKFQLRKNLDYDKQSAARGRREGLSRAADEYKKTLEFAEAHPSTSPKAESADRGGAAAAASGGDSKKSDVTIEATATTYSCRSLRCMARVVAHEMNAASEGVVNAFAGRRSGSTGRPSSFSAVSANKGEITTGYFRKAIPGDGCFKEEKDCKLVPCPAFSQGRKCKKGESLQNCTVKKIPVRCPDTAQ